jgi:hypothetical protein
MLFVRPSMQDGRKSVLRNFELLKKANRAEELFGNEIQQTVQTVGEPPAGCGNGDGAGTQEASKCLLEPEVLEPAAAVPQLPAPLRPAPLPPGGVTWWTRIRSILRMERPR